MRKALLWTGRIFLILLLGYGLAVVVGALWPVNRNWRPPEAGVETWVTTNGMHAGFVLPLQSEVTDWREIFPPTDFAAVDSTFRYLSIGWGERTFYVETPTWDDLTAGNTLRALFWPTPAALHITYLREPPPVGGDCRPLRLRREEYERLTAYILAAAQRDEHGRPHRIGEHGYTDRDNFYEAHGRYHLLYTCNNWTNEGLRRAGVRTAVWSPLDWGVMRWRRSEE